MSSLPLSSAVPSPEYLAESRGHVIRGIVWVSAGVPIVLVCLRVYTRVCLRFIFGIDDWFIVFSLFLLVAYAAVVEVAVEKGFGRHIEWFIEAVPQNAVLVALLGQISQPLVVMSCAMGKTSFAVSLMRLAEQRWIHALLWALVVSMNALHILISIIVFMRCKDPRTTWDPSIKSECWEPQTYLNVMYFIGAYSAATDFILALLPWPMLWNLNMKKKDKFGVAIAMSLGVFAGSTAIIKCTKLDANTKTRDPTFDVGELLWWAAAENGLIISAACLPCLRPLMRVIYPSTLRSSENSHPLKTLPKNIRVFHTKNRLGQWSVLGETEVHPEGQTLDDQSQRSIIQQYDPNAQPISYIH